MSYTPNFNNRAIQARIKRALDYVECYTKTNQISSISKTVLFKHFGNTSRQPGRWLLDNLLVVRDAHYNMATGQTKKYSRNDAGVQLVKRLANLNDYVPQVNDLITQQVVTGEFDYDLKSDRLFTSLQFMPKTYRNSYLNNHGYTYHYDICAAAPTLLIQKAKQINPSLELPYLDNYIINRSTVRQKIADACGLSTNQVKTIINGILQGAVISGWTHNKIFAEVNYDYDAIKKLNHNTDIINLKDDIRSLWASLRGEFSLRYIINKRGLSQRAKLSSKEKSSYYRSLEKEVGQVIRYSLRRSGVRHLWLHDGWSCDKVVDPDEIASEVRRQTGFVIKLEYTKYEE